MSKPSGAGSSPSTYTPPEAVQFLRAMYGGAPPGTTVELRPFAPPWADANLKKLANQWRVWTTPAEPDRIANCAHRASQAGATGLDVYIGVALRRARGGTAQDVTCVTALWAELDGSMSKKGNGCASKEAAFERLHAAVASGRLPEPSIVVDSGGGLHVYLLLDGYLAGEDLALVPIFNARLREALRVPAGDGSSGYAGDDVGDLPRILRLPGTMNLKRKDDLRPVRMLSCDPETRYSLDWLDGQLPPLPETSFARGGGGIATPESAELQWTAELHQKRAAIVRDAGGPWSAAEGQRHFLPHPIARVLLVAGWPWQDIPALVGEIASAGGSQDPEARQRDAWKELTDRSSRARVGWPWLRSNVPDLAEALGAHLNPSTDDIAQLAARVAAERAPVAAPAPEAPPAPAPPAERSNVVPLFKPPGIPSIDAIRAMQAAAPPAAEPTVEPAGETPAEGGPPPGGPGGPSGGGSGGDKKGANPFDGHAPEKILALLRARIAWMGRNKNDQRIFAGRRRFDPVRGVGFVDTIDLQGDEASFWALEVTRAGGLPLTSAHREVALQLLQAEARHTEVDVALRFSATDDGCWIVDLGDDSWQRARIAPGHWSLESAEDSRFRRSALTLPMVADPTATGADLLDGLQAVLGYDDETCAKIACWMPQAMHPSAPRLGLLVTGSHGSGKSTAARIVRTIFDPSRTPLLNFDQKRGGEVDERKYNVHAAVQSTLCYDNVSHLSQQASDMLCRFITGSGHLDRQLHTDAEAVFRSGRNGVMLTGIGILGMGADLQDRLLHIRLPVREGNETEVELERRLAEWIPRLTGGLFAVTARALELLPEIEREHASLLARCRMRDAAAIYAATAAALDLDAGDLLQRLIRDRADAQGAEAETDIVGERIFKYIEQKRGFNPGQATFYDGRLDALDEALLGSDRKPELWPKSTQTLRAKIERLVPGLKARGIDVRFFRSRDTSRASSVSFTAIPGALPLDAEAEDRPILPARFGDAVQTLDDFLAGVGCVCDPLVDVIARGSVPGYEAWQPRAAAIRALADRERARVFAAVGRRHVIVELPAPEQLQTPTVRWIEAQHGAVANGWHAWLVNALAMLETNATTGA